MQFHSFSPDLIDGFEYTMPFAQSRGLRYGAYAGPSLLIVLSISPRTVSPAAFFKRYLMRICITGCRLSISRKTLLPSAASFADLIATASCPMLSGFETE